MSSFNWNMAGRVDSFTFEWIRPGSKQLATVVGELEGVVDGSLTFYSDSDTQANGQLSVISQKSNLSEVERLIRVKYHARLGDDTTTVTLGTFYFTADLSYDNGEYSGTIYLNSMLSRYADDKLPKNWTLRKGHTYAQCFQRVIKSFGGWGGLQSFHPTAKVKKNHVFKVGDSVLSVLQHIADNCGGELGITPNGKVVMRKKRSTATLRKASPDYVITTAKDSVVKQGLEITNTIKEIPNRVVCVYSENKKNYTGCAVLAAKEARSHSNIKRWITQVYQVTNCKKPYETYLKKKAKSKLRAANHKHVNYTFECFYQPVSLGDLIELHYGDISVRGVVRSIEMDLSVGVSMKITIRKV